MCKLDGTNGSMNESLVSIWVMVGVSFVGFLLVLFAIWGGGGLQGCKGPATHSSVLVLALVCDK